jgi:chromosome partitioning protein
MKTIAFFGIKGGTGKTAIVYHLTWMLAERGLRVMMADLDPQANLTAWSLGEERAQALWQCDVPPTISTALRPVIEGQRADPVAIIGQPLSERILLLPGDLGLFQYEDILSSAWHQCIFEPQTERAFHRMNALNDVIQPHARRFRADVVLIDLAPNLGAINRAALIAANCVVFPLIPDRLSVLGLANMGHVLREWGLTWATVVNRLFDPPSIFNLAKGEMRPIGYVLSRLSVFKNRLTMSDAYSADAIAVAYAKHVTGESPPPPGADDPNCLGQIKNYQSLAAMAYDAHKPMFLLRPGDGAIGGHQRAAQDAYHAFRMLAERVAGRIGLRFPDS